MRYLFVVHFAGEADVIKTDRLDLHMVTPAEYELLSENRSDPNLWIDRGFTNPHEHFVENPGPIRHRTPLVREDPSLAPYLLRVAVLRSKQIIVGSAGFHGPPDVHAMIEIGMEIVQACRGQGLAQELLVGMWDWVLQSPAVATLRYTVSPTNAASQAIIRKLNFHYQGQQIDEEDGPEDIFEMSAAEYRMLRAI